MIEGLKLSAREIAIYLFVWSILALCLFGFLRWRYTRNYTKEKYEAILTTTSKYRVMVNDPCQHQIYGDPVTTFSNFAKVFLYCGKNETSANTIDLGVLHQNDYASLLTELGRINGFKVSFGTKGEVSLGGLAGEGKRWLCFDDEKPIEDFGTEIKQKSRVECFFDFSLKEIMTRYEK